ncbi:hypothetical protein [Pseudomonas putida]|uniref:hypothetical protein n=1 Tax=Pseudomonas putida TaxID=303 RepID=UPI00235D092A|nr:hypothetical protein [Pseudomonas putida]GLO48543.1 hypothetical protein PPUN109347_51080 [Pseudomonas putida]
MWQDPTGHYSRGWGSNDDPEIEKEKRGVEFWLNIGVLAMNVVLTTGFALVTAGAATPLAMGVLAVGITATLASAATQVAAEFTEDPEKKKKLGIAYLSLSIAGTLALTVSTIKGYQNKRAANNARKDTTNSTENSSSNSRRRSSTGDGRKETHTSETQTMNQQQDDLSPHSSRRSNRKQITIDEPDYSDSDSGTPSTSQKTTSAFVENGGAQVDANNIPLAPKGSRVLNKYGHTVISVRDGATRMNVFKDTFTRNQFIEWLPSV